MSSAASKVHQLGDVLFNVVNSVTALSNRVSETQVQLLYTQAERNDDGDLMSEHPLANAVDLKVIQSEVRSRRYADMVTAQLKDLVSNVVNAMSDELRKLDSAAWVISAAPTVAATGQFDAVPVYSAVNLQRIETVNTGSGVPLNGFFGRRLASENVVPTHAGLTGVGVQPGGRFVVLGTGTSATRVDLGPKVSTISGDIIYVDVVNNASPWNNVRTYDAYWPRLSDPSVRDVVYETLNLSASHYDGDEVEIDIWIVVDDSPYIGEISFGAATLTWSAATTEEGQLTTLNSGSVPLTITRHVVGRTSDGANSANVIIARATFTPPDSMRTLTLRSAGGDFELHSAGGFFMAQGFSIDVADVAYSTLQPPGTFVPTSVNLETRVLSLEQRVTALENTVARVVAAVDAAPTQAAGAGSILSTIGNDLLMIGSFLSGPIGLAIASAGVVGVAAGQVASLADGTENMTEALTNTFAATMMYKSRVDAHIGSNLTSLLEKAKGNIGLHAADLLRLAPNIPERDLLPTIEYWTIPTTASNGQEDSQIAVHVRDAFMRGDLPPFIDKALANSTRIPVHGVTVYRGVRVEELTGVPTPVRYSIISGIGEGFTNARAAAARAIAKGDFAAAQKALRKGPSASGGATFNSVTKRELFIDGAWQDADPTSIIHRSHDGLHPSMRGGRLIKQSASTMIPDDYIAFNDVYTNSKPNWNRFNYNCLATAHEVWNAATAWRMPKWWSDADHAAMLRTSYVSQTKTLITNETAAQAALRNRFEGVSLDDELNKIEQLRDFPIVPLDEEQIV